MTGEYKVIGGGGEISNQRKSMKTLPLGSTRSLETFDCCWVAGESLKWREDYRILGVMVISHFFPRYCLLLVGPDVTVSKPEFALNCIVDRFPNFPK